MEVKSEITNEKLIETQISKHGIFTLVKDETGVRIVIQNQLVSDKVFKSYEDAEKYIDKKPYLLILIASHIYTNTVNRMQNEQTLFDKNIPGKDNQN